MSYLQFEERLPLLNHDHIRPLQRFREQMLRRLPSQTFVPNFDPVDAGIDASILLLLETPGRVPRETRFTSLDNHSDTSKNVLALLQETRLLREHVVMWNLVPWDINDATKVRATTVADRERGTEELLRLLLLLPRLKVIVFFGDNAQKAIPTVSVQRSDLRLVRSPHPSNQNLNSRPWKRAEVLVALQVAAGDG